MRLETYNCSKQSKRSHDKKLVAKKSKQQIDIANGMSNNGISDNADNYLWLNWHNPKSNQLQIICYNPGAEGIMVIKLMARFTWPNKLLANSTPHILHVMKKHNNNSKNSGTLIVYMIQNFLHCWSGLEGHQLADTTGKKWNSFLQPVEEFHIKHPVEWNEGWDWGIPHQTPSRMKWGMILRNSTSNTQ